MVPGSSSSATLLSGEAPYRSSKPIAQQYVAGPCSQSGRCLHTKVSPGSRTHWVLRSKALLTYKHYDVVAFDRNLETLWWHFRFTCALVCVPQWMFIEVLFRLNEWHCRPTTHITALLWCSSVNFTLKTKTGTWRQHKISPCQHGYCLRNGLNQFSFWYWICIAV